MTTLPRLYFANRQAYKRHLAQESARPGVTFQGKHGPQPEPADWKADSASTDGLFPDAGTSDPEGDPPRLESAAG